MKTTKKKKVNELAKNGKLCWRLEKKKEKLNEGRKNQEGCHEKDICARRLVDKKKKSVDD